MKIKHIIILALPIILTAGCVDQPGSHADVLIIGGMIVDGSGKQPHYADVALLGDKITFIGRSDTTNIKAVKIIQADGMIVSPGFIDPHTHSLSDLKSKSKNSNINYLTQGVTTVINGNDGVGPYDLNALSQELLVNGIGTNTAFFVGHGKVRRTVLGEKNNTPDSVALASMINLVVQGMRQGALGLSSGLYYSPGSFAETEELIALARVIKPFGGVYESHIRDESTYNVGLLEAVSEAIEIGKSAEVPVHLAHIKALGVDVWGQSTEIISRVAKAHASGVKVTADQYPWRASGTRIGNALLNRWVMAGGKDEYEARLQDESLLPQIKAEMQENIRRRGGAEALLITADCRQKRFIGKTLQQVADDLQISPVETALLILRAGDARVASFNMDEADIINFMKQPWVMSCSDGTKGHPRKYASFPKKYQNYVQEQKILSLEEFVHRSSGLVAETFGLAERGKLIVGFKADVLIWSAADFRANADYSNPEELSTGMEYVFVNGKPTIKQGKYSGALAGRVIKKNQSKSVSN